MTGRFDPFAGSGWRTIPANRPFLSDLAAGVLDWRALLAEAGDWLRRLSVKAPDPTAPVRSLSGGNQQRVVLARWMARSPKVLVLTDLFGATPCNVAQQLNDGVYTRLVAGVNLPMLLRSVCYRHESLEALANRAHAGGTQGVMPVGSTAPQNQTGKRHASSHHDHQQ